MERGRRLSDRANGQAMRKGSVRTEAMLLVALTAAAAAQEI